INKSLTLTGPGATNLTISGGGPVFRVETNVTFNLLGLSVTCGSAAQGAGVYNNGGRLWISDCVFATTRACGSNGSPGAYGDWGGPGTDGQPGKGGAILNLGTLTLTHCGFYDNLANGGNGGSGGDASGSAGVGGGRGGQGAAGEGGAIYNAGELAFHDCQFLRNQAVGGNGGDGGFGAEGGGGGGAAGDARGGAILDLKGCAGSDSSFIDNTARAGKGGNLGGSSFNTAGQDGRPGGNADGGAICDFGRVSLSGCSLARNRVSGGPGGSCGTRIWSGGGGGWGKGGAIRGSVALSMLNSTVAYNLATGGAGGTNHGSWPGSTGADGTISGADLTGGYISLTNCTICSTGKVASVDVTAGGATVVNTILVNIGPGAGSAGPVSTYGTNFLQGDPRLCPLGYYGGPTPTMPPNCDSPVIDAGDDALCPPTDQRGVNRPLAAGSDIGACEGCPSSAPEGPRMLPGSIVCSNGQFGFTLQSQPGLSFEVQASTNLVNWATVATLTNSNGTIPFTTPTAGFTRRFYRARQLP
ncbi:MAG: hypothetical protein NT154_26085, partial [Verrucomicrobia bacterium]|nr:hypothetical protein [Verrucomicrobiota bacterium]